MSAGPGEQGHGWGLPLAVFLAAALLVGVQAWRQDAPTDAAAEQLVVARSLAHGRGFALDAVGSYAVAVRELPAPSDRPPAAALLRAPFLALGDMLAPLPPVLWSALAAALVCVVASRVLGSPWLGAACGLAYACHPSLRTLGASGDPSVLFAAALLGVVLLFEAAARDPESRGRAVVLGGLIGVAALTRSDGLVAAPLACLLAAWVARRHGLPTIGRAQAGWVALGAALLLVPWSLRCLLTFGQPWMPGASKTLFLGSATELFSWERPPTWTTYRAHLAADPVLPLRRAAASFASDVRAWLGALGHPAWSALTVPGTLLLLWTRRPGRKPALLLVCLCLALGLVHALPAGRGLAEPSAPVTLPLLLIAAAFPLALAIERWEPTPRAGDPARVLLLALAVGWALAILGEQALRRPPRPPSLRADYEVLERFLSAKGAPPAMPVIGPHPHLLHLATRRPALMLPSDDVVGTLRLARAFRSKLVLLHDEALLAAPAYAELRRIYEGQAHPAFDLVYTRGALKLYRVHPHVLDEMD